METDIFKQHIDRIHNSAEHKLIREVNSLMWSFRIFHENYGELINVLKLLEDEPDSIKLWDVSRKKDLHATFEEIGRLLFNFLAAAFMHIDHTRRCTDKLYTHGKYRGFHDQYKKEIADRFGNDANHQIAKGLRNYMQHRNLPDVGSRITFTQTSFSKAFMIPIESLLEWDGWSPIAREKLQTMGKIFPLRQFVEDYFNQIESFHKWLREKQVELHMKDVKRLNELKQEAILALKNAGLITDDQIKRIND